MTNITWSGGSEGIKYTKDFYRYDPDMISYQNALDKISNENYSIISESLLSDGKLSIAVDAFRLDYEYGNFRSYGSTLSYGDTDVYVEKYGRRYLTGKVYGSASVNASGAVNGYFNKVESTNHLNGVKSVSTGNFDYSRIGPGVNLLEKLVFGRYCVGKNGDHFDLQEAALDWLITDARRQDLGEPSPQQKAMAELLGTDLINSNN